MSFPSPSVATPALTTWQMSYGGLAFGGVTTGATYQLQELPEGIDIPDYLSGDAQRAMEQGEFAGLDLAPGRNIAVKQVVTAPTAVALDQARQALSGVLGVKGTTEEPLFIQMPSGVFACMARPRKHKHVVDVTTVFGKATIVATQFHATDPRWYAAPSSAATVGLPAPAGGLLWPTVWPAVWPGGAAGSQVTCTNEGKFDVLPVFVVTGPCVGPKITNLSLPGAPSIGFNVTLRAGDVLTIGTDVQSAVLVTSGSSEGASRRGLEMAGSRWFDFPPGENVVRFTTEDTSAVAGTLTVQWASAFLGL